MIHKIWHTTGPDRFLEIKNQPRILAGSMDVHTLTDAFTRSQNFDDHWNPNHPCRSTSVGDVIQNDEGYFMVAGFGFTKLTDYEFFQPGMLIRTKHNYYKLCDGDFVITDSSMDFMYKLHGKHFVCQGSDFFIILPVV